VICPDGPPRAKWIAPRAADAVRSAAPRAEQAPHRARAAAHSARRRRHEHRQGLHENYRPPEPPKDRLQPLTTLRPSCVAVKKSQLYMYVGGKAGREPRAPALPALTAQQPQSSSSFFVLFPTQDPPSLSPDPQTPHQPPLCLPHTHPPHFRSLTTSSQRSGEGVVNDRPEHALRNVGQAERRYQAEIRTKNASPPTAKAVAASDSTRDRPKTAPTDHGRFGSTSPQAVWEIRARDRGARARPRGGS
jgi:hypothetical protein